MLKLALIIFILTFLFVCAYQFIGRFVLNYDVHQGRIRILLFSFLPIVIIPIEKELEIEELSLIRTIRPKFSRVNFNNRFVGNVVEIKKTHGMIRCLSITPDNPASFVRQVKYAQALSSNKSQ